MKWFSKKNVKRLSSAVAFSVVAGLNMGAAEAAVDVKGAWDKLAKRYFVDISEISDDINSVQQHAYIYSYDKDTDTIKGGKILHNDAGHDISLALRASDLNGLSAAKIEEIMKRLAEEKYTLAKDDNTVPKARVVVLDNENKNFIAADIRKNAEGDYVYHRSFAADEQLINDGKRTQYNIVNNNLDLIGTTFNEKNEHQGMMMVAPDMTSVEGVKCVIKGAENPLTVSAINNTSVTSPTFYVSAVGGENDKVYGIYNDAEGDLTIKGTFTVIHATGKDAVGVYAGNSDEEYQSKVSFQGPRLTFITDGNAVEAGKNGNITIQATKMTGSTFLGNDSGKVDIRNSGGYSLYAHDGGKISVNDAVIGMDEDKTVIKAENGGIIILGATEKNGTLTLSGTGYNKVTGKVVADADSSVNIAFNSSANDWFTGSTSGNVNLYLDGGAAWNVRGDSTLNNFIGSAKESSVGAINMQKGDVTIEKFSGLANAYFTHTEDAPTVLSGGKLTIKSADWGATLKLVTDNSGIDYNNTALVENVLDALANKLVYSGRINGEVKLKAEAHIAEGLTASAVSKRYSRLGFDAATGQAKRDGEVIVDDNFHQALIVNNNISADGYSFDEDITISGAEKLNYCGPFGLGDYYAALESHPDKPVTIDMKGHKLVVSSSSPGITGTIYSTNKIEINNCGGLDVFSESYCEAACSALAPNGGGEIIIHNAQEGDTVDQLWGKVVKLRAQSNNPASATAITSRNGSSDSCSHIVIDGLVDIEVDAGVEGGEFVMDGDGVTSIQGGTKLRDYGSNYGINSVASVIDIGGGKIICKNGAYAALNAYGEFVSSNNGVININVVTGEDGLPISGGKLPVMIEGDFSTSGGMGTNGRISVGLTTPDSYWSGNYLYCGGYGVTQGEYGCTNLFMDNGATWTGSALGTVKADMQGGAKWNGVSTNPGSVLSIRDGALFTSNENGANKFGILSGATDGNLGGIMMTKGASLDIADYSGETNVFYAHEATAPTNIIGGNITIAKAAAGSKINLITGNNGINTADDTAVDNVLNALANKLYYTAYTTGERNLDGYVKIAEGLTSSSVVKYLGNIKFDNTSGQGSLDYSFNNLVSKQLKKEEGNDKIEITENTAVIVTEKDTSVGAVVAAAGNGEATNIEAKNKTLVLDAKSKDSSDKAVTVYANGTNGAVNVAAKNVAINASGAEGSAAIATNAGGAVEIKADDTKITGNITNAANGTVKVEAAATEVKGNITNDGGTVDLTKAGNTNITGNITNNEGGEMLIGGMGKTTVIVGNTVNNGDMSLILDGKASSYTGSIDPTDLTLSNEAKWNNGSIDSDIKTLTSFRGIINQSAGSGALSIDKLSGDVTINYDSVYSAGKLTVDNTAGKVTLKDVDTGKANKIIINTNNNDVPNNFSKEKYADPLTALAKKLNYTGTINADGTVNNLEAKAMVNEGLTRSSAETDIFFKNADGENNFIGEIKTNDILYGAYETQIMKGSRAAMTSSAMAWRAEANDLMRRMGDLRLSPDQLGAWARFYRGRSASDKDNANYKLNYATIQAGYDWQAGKNWRLGTAISYMEGKSGYDMGSGENKEYNLGFYSTWNDDKGQYVDLIAKIGRLTNDYTVYNESGYKVDGDYGNLGLSLSAEYGKKFRQQSGFYFEPSAELNYTHLNGADYTAHSNYPFGNMRVSQSSFNSLIGRIAVGFGYETPKSTVYAKLSLNHEFCGGLTSSFSAEEFKSIDQNFRDTWVGLQIGGTAKLSDKCNFYGNIEKTFGGDIKTDYRIDAGFRFEF